MGCASSKLDDLPAVALCRERCSHLDEAIQQRYALAEAHLGYLHSLRSVGVCLHRFFDHDLANSPPSPVIHLPTHRKGDDPQPSQNVIDNHHRHSHSNSGSHLNFHTDSDSDDLDSDSESESHLRLHSGSNSPIHGYGQVNNYGHGQVNHGQGQINQQEQEEMSSMYSGGGFMGMGMNMNYMRNSSTPAVTYEQRPMTSETVRIGETSSSASASYYPNPNPYYNYQGYGGVGGGGGGPPGYGGGPPGYGGGGGGINGFFAAPQAYSGGSSYPAAGPSGAAAMEASTSKPPPPPPSPPRTSGWDFLNPFESYESYYPPYTPSRDSREVREEEGIPDLEEEDFQNEVVKEVDMNQKFADNGGGGGGGGGGSGGKNYSKGVVIDEQRHAGKAADSDNVYDNNNNARQSGGSVESEPVEYEVHVVDKKVVEKEESSADRGNVAAFKASADSEVVKEIQVQFERASESGTELAKMLEVGKFPYKRKAHSHGTVSSKMLSVMTPSLPVVSSSLPSTSASVEGDPAFLDNENVAMRSGNLSSTLQKLYLWEKKLYEEVKAEEKMRVLHERKSTRLKRLDEKGAETHKIDATRTLVRSLSTKIRIAIQVVDKISVKINTLRDEELWPQMNEFVQGLTRMWKAMYECHHTQCQAIAQAKRLDAVASGNHFSDAHLEATLQLEQELLNWTFRFSSWISSQKGYVRAINHWLLKCLLYVPEETPDGIVPFSPGRIGAPPIFVICNQWSQALERISEKEVIEALRDFATSVLQLWERDKQEMRHRMMAGKDMERKVKHLEREDQKIHKELQALDKRIVLISGEGNGMSLSGHVVFQSDTSRSSSLQVNLQHIFEAMDRFTANSSKAYEELVQRIEEDRLDRLAREEESS